MQTEWPQGSTPAVSLFVHSHDAKQDSRVSRGSICSVHVSMVLAGYQVLLWVEGAASLLGTGPVEGMGAAVQATANGSTSALTVCTPAIAIVQC